MPQPPHSTFAGLGVSLADGSRDGSSDSQWSEKRPLYRAVELVLNSYGRLEKEGRIWHSDLNRARRFGRALAANTTGYKVQVLDGSGKLVEELSPTDVDLSTGSWKGWQDLALPPLSTRQAPARPQVRSTPPSRKPPSVPMLPSAASVPADVSPTPAPAAAASTPQPAEIPQLEDLIEEIPEAPAAGPA